MSVIRSHDEDMERIRVEHENAMEQSREQTKREVAVYTERNKEGRIPFAIALVIVLGVVAIVYVVTVAVRSDGREKNHNAPIELKQEATREATCIENGGGWLTEEMVVGDHGLCVFPSKATTN